MDVGEWLRGLGLADYAPAFRDNNIDSRVLRQLTAEDLRDLGVTSVGHRRRLLDAIAALRHDLNLLNLLPLPARRSLRKPRSAMNLRSMPYEMPIVRRYAAALAAAQIRRAAA